MARSSRICFRRRSASWWKRHRICWRGSGDPLWWVCFGLLGVVLLPPPTLYEWFFISCWSPFRLFLRRSFCFLSHQPPVLLPLRLPGDLFLSRFLIARNFSWSIEYEIVCLTSVKFLGIFSIFFLFQLICRTTFKFLGTFSKFCYFHWMRDKLIWKLMN